MHEYDGNSIVKRKLAKFHKIYATRLKARAQGWPIAANKDRYTINPVPERPPQRIEQ